MDYYRIVDSAEPESLRTPLLEMGWTQQRLASGDFCFLTKDNLKVGITRKTTQDYLNSIGELFSKQLDEMLDAYDICLFVLEGALSFDLPTGIILGVQGDHKIHEAMDYLHRWQVKGFVLERSPSTAYTVQRLCHLYALWQKPYSLSARSRKWADERVLALCSGLRGKAGQDALSNHSIAELCMMGTRQLEELPGIGTKRALNLFNHLHRKSGNNNAVPE